MYRECSCSTGDRTNLFPNGFRSCWSVSLPLKSLVYQVQYFTRFLNSPLLTTTDEKSRKEDKGRVYVGLSHS